VTHLIATCFGAGYLRPAPGTWASLVALPAAWALHWVGGFALLALGTAAVFGLGWWAAATETREHPGSDPSEIVIDEVAGQWIALWPVSLWADAMNADILRLWPGWMVAFLGFRLFDILKPGPVGWADRRGDALGIMLDDVIAGLLAALPVLLAVSAVHGLFHP